MPYQLLLIPVSMMLLLHCDLFSPGVRSTEAKQLKYWNPAVHAGETIELRHLVYDETRKYLYVSASSNIYKLSEQVKEEDRLPIDPHDENIRCPYDTSEPCPPGVMRISTDWTSQFLVVDTASETLLACGNLFNGSCLRIGLDDLSPHEQYPNLVTNDPARSAVALVVPGSLVDLEHSVVYIASSQMCLNQTCPKVHMLSRRHALTLDYPQNIPAFIDVVPEKRTEFPVEFITSFMHHGYAYFVSTHRISISNPEIGTFLIRLCLRDNNFSSYSELRLECRMGNSASNIRSAVLAPVGSKLATQLTPGVSHGLYATFTRQEPVKGSIPSVTGDSAICMFDMQSIEERIQQITADCHRGDKVTYTGPYHVVHNQEPCIKSNHPVPLNYCGGTSYNYPVSGDVNKPMNYSVRVLIPDLEARSIQVDVVNNITVVFLGSNNSRIFKLALNTPNNASIYGEVLLEQNLDRRLLLPVKTLVMDSTRYNSSADDTHLFAMTQNKVYRVPRADCHILRSCEQCIPDPHCGWCTVTNKCTVYQACPSITLWQKELCPNVTQLQPQNVSSDKYTSTKFQVDVNFLPAVYKSVECHIEEHGSSSKPGGTGGNVKGVMEELSGVGLEVRGKSRTVFCQGFSTFVRNSDSVAVNMSLSIFVDGTRWVTAVQPITIFSCRKYTSCMSCTSSTYSCLWCSQQHICLFSDDATLSNCSIDNSGPKTSNATCPRVEPNTQLLLVAAQEKKSFTFVAYNLVPSFENTLQCRFKMSTNRFVRSKASVLPGDVSSARSQVTCAPADFSYSGSEPQISTQFDLVWGDDFTLDSPTTIFVQVYKCVNLASTCGLCLTLAQGYQCGWCPALPSKVGGRCAFPGENCGGTVWMDKDQVCTNPEITSLYPAGGPVLGNTLLTITGINLGKVASDVSVTVGGKQCTVENLNYKPSQSVVCKVPASNNGSGHALVIATVVKSFVAHSPKTYHYKNAEVNSLTPRRGPLSGGTRITLQGSYLDYGSTIESVVVTGVTPALAPVILRSYDKIVLLTPHYLQKGRVSIIIRVDKADLVVRDQFEYVDDPMILNIRPRIAIVSGGTAVIVDGTHLDSVLSPLFIVHHGTNNRTSPCILINSTAMRCTAPNLHDLVHDPSALKLLSTPLNLAYGFIMDNVTRLRNITATKSNRTITYYMDPIINKFTQIEEYSRDQRLDIMGENLDVFQKPEFLGEFSVTVGGANCLVYSFKTSVLTCRPPRVEEIKVFNKNKQALVVVSIGGLRKEVGLLSYAEPFFTIPIILGLSGGLFLIIILLLLLCICVIVRKRRQRKPKHKASLPTLVEMETRHSSVRETNSYISRRGRDERDGGGTAAGEELRPLKDGETAYSEITDMEIKDDKLYFQELLKRINNSKVSTGAWDVYIKRERLELGNLIGKGHFGRVFAATLRNDDMQEPIKVAVKTIDDEDLTQKAVESFLQEGIFMKNFNHPHVLSLLGLCLGYKKEPMVILPYMANGDLRTYIKDKRMSFTARQLLLLAQHVAEGMSYLSSRNFIHRDLAARNCMIDDKSNVKVADFGLSHELYDREYYTSKDHRAKLPIKWMALESLESFVFTVKSDVWSFGVLLWELMTRGVTPYPDVEVFETRNYLATGRRLRKPKFCPDTVYAIMTDCWQELPERRPSFNDLVNRLEFLLNPPKQVQNRGGAASSTDGPEYINMTDTDNQDYLKPISGPPETDDGRMEEEEEDEVDDEETEEEEEDEDEEEHRPVGTEIF